MNPDNHNRISEEDLPIEWDDSINEDVVSLDVVSFQVNRRDSLVSPFQVRLWFEIGDELVYWETLLSPDQAHDLRTRSSKRKLANQARKKFRDEIDDGDIDAIANIKLLPDTK